MRKFAMSRAKEAITLASEEREHLERSARLHRDATVPALRARVILLSADGLGSEGIATRLGLAPSTVRLWRRRFLQSRLEGLRDRHRPGRPREVDDELLGAVIVATMEAYLRAAPGCSTRGIGEKVGVSQSTVSRIWRTYGLLPADIVRGRRRAVAELVGLYISSQVRAAAFVVEVARSPLRAAVVDDRRDPHARAGQSLALVAAFQAAAHGQKSHVDFRSFADFLCTVDGEVAGETWIDVLVEGASLVKTSSAHVLWLRRRRFRWHVSRSYASWLRRIGHWTRAASEPKGGRDGLQRAVADVVVRVGAGAFTWIRPGERHVGGPEPEGALEASAESEL